jgi:hypothetical protein
MYVQGAGLPAQWLTAFAVNARRAQQVHALPDPASD